MNKVRIFCKDILFPNGEMIYPHDENDFIILLSGEIKFCQEIAPTCSEIYEVEDFCSEIYSMQFIGIKDKNDKEIYEGDIISSKNFKDIMIVENDTFCGFKPFNDIMDYCYSGGLEKELIEVIGNIHQNPELLK